MFKIQLEAPQPNPIKCNQKISDRPLFYENDYHGEINHKKTEEILKLEVDGSYLVRKSPGSDNNFYTLSLRFDNKTKHFKIYYNNGHYLQEDFKTFDTLKDLVADGLVNFYM